MDRTQLDISPRFASAQPSKAAVLQALTLIGGGTETLKYQAVKDIAKALLYRASSKNWKLRMAGNESSLLCAFFVSFLN